MLCWRVEFFCVDVDADVLSVVVGGGGVGIGRGGGHGCWASLCVSRFGLRGLGLRVLGFDVWAERYVVSGYGYPGSRYSDFSYDISGYLGSSDSIFYAPDTRNYARVDRARDEAERWRKSRRPSGKC